MKGRKTPSVCEDADTSPGGPRGRRKRKPDCAEDGESGHPACGLEIGYGWVQSLMEFYMRVFLCLVVFLGMGMSLIGGCATVRNDKFKQVEFTSEPSGATVSFDEEVMGTTPCDVQIARKGRDKLVSIELDGYKSVLLNLNRSVEGKTVFGGLIGMSVDAISGKAGTYSDSVHVVLEKGEGMVEVDSKELEREAEEAGGEDSAD